MSVLLTTAYCPPVEYFAAIAEDFDWRRGKPADVVVEACEHYQKQSWRNRCRIYAADGPLDLNYPVRHDCDLYGTSVSDVRIDWSVDWLTRHKRAIFSAYRTSPYFEYYQDDFFAVLDERLDRLIDYNTAILCFFLERLHIGAVVRFSESFEAPAEADKQSGDGIAVGNLKDYRYVIHPKLENDIMARLGQNRPYYQVFADRCGFQPHLSAMDLLFNEGPDSLSFLLPLESDGEEK